MKSAEFYRFRQSCFSRDFGNVREGVDVQALLSLEGDERSEAEAMLLEVIESTDDSRPIRAVGILKLDSAVKSLNHRLQSGIDSERPYNRVATALSLFRITQFESAADIIVDVLHNADPERQQWSRMEAVDALAQLGPKNTVINILLESLQDADIMIAGGARRSLSRMFAEDDAIKTILFSIDQRLIRPRQPIDDLLIELKELIAQKIRS